MLAFRTTFDAINEIVLVNLSNTRTLETYLVSRIEGLYVPITPTRQAAEQINTLPVRQAFEQSLSGRAQEYLNYTDTEVFGHFLWLPQLQAVLVSEIAQDEALVNLFRALPVYLSVGAVMILLVLATVFITSQTISRPIEALAQQAAALADGKLDIRLQTDRRDEFGNLVHSFNRMAAELENLVHTLESRVNERTQDLRKQANYLRIAAEVARDAANAQDLEELLNRAAQLVLDRFGFYHTGIFLIDLDGEYAVLRASPTEAGRKMLEQGHRLKLGQVGLVGYAAATGTLRIALDTGQDTAYFKNPCSPTPAPKPPFRSKSAASAGRAGCAKHPARSLHTGRYRHPASDGRPAGARHSARGTGQQPAAQPGRTRDTYRSFTIESWERSQPAVRTQIRLSVRWLPAHPLQSLPENAQQMLSKGRTVVIPAAGEQGGTTVLTPLKLREQVLGGLALRFHTPTVDMETISLAEETAARLAVALENARLYSESQNLVQRERAVSEISRQITASFNIEAILRAAVTEIGRRVPDAEVIVELEAKKD